MVWIEQAVRYIVQLTIGHEQEERCSGRSLFEIDLGISEAKGIAFDDKNAVAVLEIPDVAITRFEKAEPGGKDARATVFSSAHPRNP